MVVYTQRYNRYHQRIGHVFQDRYKSILVAKEEYLRELSRYIVLNPVRARMIRLAIEWPWSSYRAAAGYTSPGDRLSTDWILSGLAKHTMTAGERYRTFAQQRLLPPP